MKRLTLIENEDTAQQMNVLRRKFYRYLLLAIACVLLVFALVKIYQDREIDEIFKMVESIDLSRSEKPVSDKLSQLLTETQRQQGSPDTWGRLGMNLYIHGFKEISIRAFQKAAALNEKDFRWPYFCAIAMDELNSEQAAAWYQRGGRLKPQYPPLHVKLGNRYLLDEELQKARESFYLAVASWERVPHAYLGLAKVAVATNDLDEALSQLHKAVELAPEYREARALLADVYRNSGEISKAERELETLKELPQKLDLADQFYDEMIAEGVSSFWCEVRASRHLASGQLAKAEKELQKVVEVKPHPSSYVNLANVYQNQRRYEMAIEHYRMALELDSNYVDALNNLGVAYFKSGHIQEAISAVRQAVKIRPDLGDAHLNLGTFYKDLGRRAEAVDGFRRGLELAPKDMRFAYQLSWLLSSSPEPGLRDGREALRLAEIVCEYSDYKTPASLDLLAAAMAENESFEQAVDIAGRAYQLAAATAPKLAKDIKARLELYKSNQPYREK